MAVQGAGYTGGEVAVKKEAKDFIYSDLNFHFTPSTLFLGQGISGDVLRVFDENSIRQSLKNILETNNFEKPFRPFFGCGNEIRKLLFAGTHDFKDFYIVRKSIINNIGLHEPRVIVNDVSMKRDENTLTMGITIDYKIRGINQSGSTEIKISTERI